MYSVIVEALKMDSLQRLYSSVETLLKKIVSEEVERALAKLDHDKLDDSLHRRGKRICNFISEQECHHICSWEGRLRESKERSSMLSFGNTIISSIRTIHGMVHG
ncbi:unnamed protein product [Lathyrus sativus]|nr:unnamed protein product [Lathyrus sativus]